MNIEEREKQLNEWFENGDITQREWAKLWQESLEDLETYPDPENTTVN